VSARAAATWLALALLNAPGCGAGLSPAFDARFPDNDAASLGRVRAQLARAPQQPAAAGSDALVLATTHGAEPELIAYDLGAQRARWRVPFRADSRPELLGDVALSASGERLFGFDAASGRSRFRAELPHCAYLGAARDGERIFFSCQHEGRTSLEARGRLTALDARSGSVLWKREASGTLGRPAALGGLVFVPWQRQSLSVLDADDGRELARLRTTDDVIEWVVTEGRGVLYGQKTLHRLDGRGAERGQPLVAVEALPGRPPLLPSAFEPQPGARSARGRVALYFEPEATADGLRVAHGRFYAVFYRYVFAYDASGRLLWARALTHDVIAGRALPSGLAVVTERGQVLLLPGEDGEPLPQADLGVQLASARIAAPDLPARAARPAPAGIAPALRGGASPLPLRRSLTEIALDTDTRLVPARAYAIAQLAALHEPDVTRDLLDVYAQTATAPELKRAVADALRARRTGLEHLVDALLARYDFIEQTRPAPLAVIVPALVEARETRAVPHLVKRMFDHETPIAQLPTVVAAVAELGGEDAIEPLLSFLRLYRADSSFVQQPEALIEAARGVLRHGGESGAAALAAIDGDGRATTALASSIAALLATQPSAANAQAPVAATAPPPPPPPETLSQDAINAAFAEHVDDLRACIIDELGRNPELAQVRIAFIAESDGSAHAFSFAPNRPEFVDCLYAKVASYRFPRFRSGREVARYVIAVRAREPVATPSTDPAQEPWWQWSARSPRASGAAKRPEPWWRSHQPLAPLSVTAKTFAPSGAPPSPPATSAPSPAAAAPPAPRSQAAAGAAPTAPAPAAKETTTAPDGGAASATSPATPTAPAAEDAWWTPAAR
jgi:outer membrane protein assembly factor BamB